MYIESVVIDGFKSYAHRTVIDAFDPKFNAITGLNGSGKSNILDAICFVLGISTAHCRVNSTSELVYKNGQAGVTKASVTVNFNNKDKSCSPPSYKDADLIHVTRQIIMGSRTKYLINGRVVQYQQVTDMLHSVALNVNNPHFLIMQGRITKVLNMKPPEILGLMEEAAGTRMFEDKKLNSQKTIERKNKTLGDIDMVMTTEIEPKLKKLEQQAGDYQRHATLQVEVDRLEQYVVAGVYCKHQENLAQTTQKLEAQENRVSECQEQVGDAQRDQKRLADEIKKMKDRLAKEKQSQTSVLEQEEQRKADAVALAEGKLQNKQKDLQAEKEKVKELEGNLKEHGKLMESKTKEKDEAEKSYEVAAQKAENMDNQINNATNQVRLLQSGVAAGADGQSLTDQLMQLDQQLTESRSDIKSKNMKLNSLQKTLKEKKANSGKEDAIYSECKSQLEKLEKEIATFQQAAQSCSFVPEAFHQCQSEIDALERNLRMLNGEVERMESKLGRTRFSYNEASAGVGPSQVKGYVCSLVKQVRDPSCTTAIEVTAGGKLFNVVVDSDQTGKKILEKGQLRSRVSIIPLNRIQSTVADNHTRNKAAQVSGGQAQLALELVGYQSEVARALEYVFGRTFICPDGATAARVCKEARCRAVTKDGDDYIPGQITGGSSGNFGQTLNELMKVLDKKEEREQVAQQLHALKQKLAPMQQQKQTYQTASQELQDRQRQAEIMRQRLERSDRHQTIAVCEQMEKEIASLTEALSELNKTVQELQEKKKLVEAEIKSFAGGKERIAKVEKDIQKWKAELAGLKPALGKKTEQMERVAIELQTMEEEKEELKKQIAAQKSVCEDVKAEVAALETNLKEAQKEWKEAKKKLDETNARLRKNDEALERLQGEQDALEKKESDLNVELKNLEHTTKNLQKEIAGIKAEVDRIREKDPKFPRDQQHLFNVQGSPFDFRGVDIRVKQGELHHMKEEQKVLRQNLNAKAVAMHEEVERESQKLYERKEQVQKDKMTIEKVIEELDLKKKTQLTETHQKVSKYFTEIFSKLLPGVNARLDAQRDQDGALTGLEMKVNFGTAADRGLGELSGGQRSLLALSLILALLSYKPAPMYILDEVDSALDLSHTQNIGKLLKLEQFKKSQFIIVSLKTGMFNNANVLFQTKLSPNGQSQVTREAKNGSM